MFSMLFILIACSTSGSVILDKAAIDTASVDADDTGVVAEPDSPADTDEDETDTDSPDTDTQDPDTDTQDPDTEEPVLPADNNNPNVYPNSWQGQRTLTYGNCAETVVESGIEVTNDYPNWVAECDCDEIYYVELNSSYACGFAVDYGAFYRGVRYDGMEISVRYWPDNPSYPTPASELGVGSIMADGETWSYQYTAYASNGTAVTIDGLVSFSEQSTRRQGG